jgi:hypothetical protein
VKAKGENWIQAQESCIHARNRGHNVQQVHVQRPSDKSTTPPIPPVSYRQRSIAKDGPLFVTKPDTTTRPEAIGTLEDPDEGNDGKPEGAPVDEGVVLVCKDGEKGPGDGHAAGQVTFRGGERIRSGGALEEEQRKEDKDLCPKAGGMFSCIHAESGESREEDEQGRPPVIEGEREVNEKLVPDVLGDMIFLDNIIDVLMEIVSIRRRRRAAKGVLTVTAELTNRAKMKERMYHSTIQKCT